MRGPEIKGKDEKEETGRYIDDEDEDEDCVQVEIEESLYSVLAIYTQLAGAFSSQGTRGAHQPPVSQTVIFISRSVEFAPGCLCPFGCLVALLPRSVAASQHVARRGF